jgi:hypothetical protein
MTKGSKLIVLIGTEIDDGYVVLERDYQEVERGLKRLPQRLRRVVGKRVIVRNGLVVTAYHPSKLISGGGCAMRRKALCTINQETQ